MSGLFVPWVPLPLIPKAEKIREVQMEKTATPPRKKDYNERIREKQAEKKAAKENKKVTTQTEMLQDLM